MFSLKKLFSTLLSLFYFSSFSQTLPYARYVIDTLTSPIMSGRGYVGDGNKRAATFIANEFKKSGLVPVNENYFQNFSYPVNTFPSEIEISIDGKKLEPGKDFIVWPASGKVKGTFQLAWDADLPQQYNSDFSQKFIVVDKQNLKQSETKTLIENAIGHPKSVKGVIVLQDKLTWSVSTVAYKTPYIEILKTAVPPFSQHITISLKNKFIKEFKTQNVIGMIKGSVKPDSFIVFTAHYDHLGKMGTTYFPGANDNASGTSMLLNLAKQYGANPASCKYSMLFIGFTGEEIGLLGSQYFTEHPLVSLSKIKFLINMDLLGTGDDGIMVVNATEYKDQFNLMKSINEEKKYVVSVGERGKAKNSDHYYFSEKGVPCFFIYTLGGIKAYHDILDKAATLPLTDYEDVFKLITEFTEKL